VLARLLFFAILLVLAAPAVAAPPPGRWETKPAAPAPRQEAAFAELGGKFHLVGGFEYGGADSIRHDVYDIATETWSVATPIPEPAHHLVGVGLNGKLYVLGGLQTLAFNVTGNLWEYDPATMLWTERAGLPAGRERGAGALAAHAGRLIYVGGLRNGNEALTEVDAYDPATDTWAPLPDMPTPRDHLGVAVVGDSLYAVGGRQGAFDTEVAATEALDLKTLKWRRGLAPIPTLRAGFATAAVDGEIVTVGGEGPAGVYDQVEAYDPAANTWRSLAPSPIPRHGVQGAAHGGGIWVAGGGTDLLVGATDSLDVLFPGPRPQPALPPPPAVAPPVPAPPSGTPAPAPAAGSPRVSLTVKRPRRGARRVVLRFRGTAGAIIELRDSRKRRLARASVRAGTRTVTLRMRRGLRRGRFTVVARAGGTTVTRRFAIR
jgi:N-acetylneuraminic acid mutarotase